MKALPVRGWPVKRRWTCEPVPVPRGCSGRSAMNKKDHQGTHGIYSGGVGHWDYHGVLLFWQCLIELYNVVYMSTWLVYQESATGCDHGTCFSQELLAQELLFGATVTGVKFAHHSQADTWHNWAFQKMSSKSLNKKRFAYHLLHPWALKRRTGVAMAGFDVAIVHCMNFTLFSFSG